MPPDRRLLYAAMDPVPYPKGAATRIEASVRALLRQGWQVHLITPSAPALPGFASVLQLEGLQQSVIPLEQENFLERALAFRRAVAEQARERPYGLAVVRSIWEGLGVMQSCPDLPLIYEAHGFPSAELAYHFPGLRLRPGLLARLIEEENALLSRAQRVITPSFTGARYLHSRRVPPERIRVVPNSVLDTTAPGHPVWEPPFRLLYMGTLAPWQGVEQLVEALAHLKRKFPVSLRLAGTRKGPWLRRLRHLAQALRVRGLVEPLGPLTLSALQTELSEAHVCLAPLPDDPRNSAQGCCPIKILEYMAAGKAIVSTRIAPVEELLEHGQNAWLVAPNSPLALAEGVAHLLREPELCASLGAAARQTALERFPRQRFEQQMAAVMAELFSPPLGGTGGRARDD